MYTLTSHFASQNEQNDQLSESIKLILNCKLIKVNSPWSRLWYWGLRPRPHYHTAPEKFENDVFTLKTLQMFHSVHATPEKFENATITCNSGGKITWWSWCHRFRKASFSKCFPSTRKPKAGVFKFSRFEEGRFRESSVFVTGQCGRLAEL